MRITILTIGSRGDVQPYVALGVGLQTAGHRIRVATHACFKPMIGELGLDFFPIAGDPRGTLEGETGQKWLEANKNPFTFVKRMMDAAKPFMGQILDDYWRAAQDADLPDDVYRIDSVPFDWLFPRMTAVVHHGGAGTTATGLRAGVPTVVVPFFGDQHFWGWRVEELGAGPKPIPRRKLTVERLTSAIQEAITNKEMQSRAASLGQQIRAENGVANAVEAIARWCQR